MSLVSAFVLAGAWEWEHYRKICSWHRLPLTLVDCGLIAWLLCWKTLLCLAPALIATGLLQWRGKLKTAKAAYLVCWCLLVGWLACDMQVQRLVGNHALDYLPYVYDAVRSAGGSTHTQWAGGWSEIALLAGAVVLSAAIAGMGTWFAVERSAIWLGRRSSRLAAERLAGFATGGLLFALVGFPSLCGFASQRGAMRQLQAALPIGVEVPGLSAGAWQSGAATTLRIVALLPDPAGPDEGHEEVHLHNFAGGGLSLEGWTLVGAGGFRLPLSGRIESGRTQTVTLPENWLPLDNEGGSVTLVDPQGLGLQTASYDKGDVKYGALVNFPHAESADRLLLQLNAAVKPMYRQLQPQLARPALVDLQTRLSTANPPNVIVIVLESFRSDAVSPRLLSRLHEWSGQGLRCDGHYAGSNVSHLGLFSLLYGRSALGYDATLSAKQPPQLPATLAASGYETSFITSGEFASWRRMGEFLNERGFDRVITEGGPGWENWPQRDRACLAHVRRLASSHRPQLTVAFLMSTHFPYAFPPEFARDGSAADDVSWTNWSDKSPQLLAKRYESAALFLEQQIMELVLSLDPAKNLIVVTGDHGESLGEDGALAHATRGSDVQMRVPMLIVGPGASPQVVSRPTVHADVLPTIVHMLEGKSLHVAGVHGRDLLAEGPAEQLLLVPYRWKDPQELLLMRNGERLLFQLQLHSPEIAVAGFCDERGRLDLETVRDQSSTTVHDWAEALRSELSR